MFELTLLERLRNPRPVVERRAVLNAGVRRNSVLRHLQRMFSTRQEESLTVPGYGIPDLTAVGRFTTDSTARLEKALQESIEKYEPRLRKVRVRSIVPDEGEPLVVRFEINASLVMEDGTAGVEFKTEVNPDGKIVVIT